MALVVRPLQEADLSGFRRCMERALGFSVGPETEARLHALLDFGGSFVALDGAEIVGTLGAYRFGLSTPGGPDLDAAGTTTVSVAPTHRRQGLLRRLMSAHLDWARAAGVEVLGLWASEPTIYPRFGFGLAARRGGVTLDARGLTIPDQDDPPTLRYVDLETAGDRIQASYAAHRSRRAGSLTRTPAWWRYRRWHEDPARHRPFGPLELVEARRDETTAGYLQYRRWSRWDEGRPQDVVSVEEVVGDASTRRALWRFVLAMDLVTEVRAFNLPPDDELLWLFEQARGFRLVVEDALWLLPLDPIVLLTHRAYLGEGVLRLGLEGSGTVELEIRGGGATCRSVSATPDLWVAPAALPALAWGETRPALLADAGLIQGSPTAIRTATALFVTERRPWCPERF